MTSLYGRAMRVERACDAAPHGHWCARTLIGPVRGDCETACTAIASPADKDVFPAHVRKIPAPSLRPVDIVVPDNLRSHKAPGVVETIRSAGADVLHLPPYSPDLNPIEKMRGKIKTMPRAISAMTSPELHRTIRTAFRRVTR